MKRLAPYCLGLLAGIAPAQVVTNLWPGTAGAFTQRALDLVILGDGYTSGQQGQFNSDANQLAAALTAPAGSSGQLLPFSQYRFKFRVWSVFAASQASGVDHPEFVPAVVADTRYNCTYNFGGTARCVLPTNGLPSSNGPVHSVNGLATAIADAGLIAPLVPPQVPGVASTIFIVLVNDPTYGGCALFANSGVSFCAGYNGTGGATPPVGLQVQLHELGHALGLLEDEYDDENPNVTLAYTGQAGQPAIAFGINLTVTQNTPRWQPWVPLIGTPRQGGLGFDTGIFHPSPNSLMRRLYQNGNLLPFVSGQPLGPAQGFDVVAQEQLILQISRMSDTYTGYSPAQATPINVEQGQTQLFALSVLVGSPHLYQWRLNGVVVATSFNPVFTLNTTGMALGTYVVDCVATDQNTSIRNPAGGYVNPPSQSWTLNVNQPTPDLVATLVSSSPVSGNAGSPVPVSANVVNTGLGASGQFFIEYWLTVSPTGLNVATDVLFGREAHVGLAPNASYSSSLTPNLPFHTPAGNYYVAVIVDRAGNTSDVNLANNLSISPNLSTVGAPLGSPVVLEIAPPGVLAPNALRISASAGASLPMIVTAPQLSGQTYLLAVSVTGTSPGTPFGAFTVPLVFDFATQFCLDNINVVPFVAFLGTLDANGRGFATYAPPPGFLSPGNFDSWFAAVVMNAGTPTGVTNPVQVRVGS